jgi:hypothetical protein
MINPITNTIKTVISISGFDAFIHWLDVNRFLTAAK